MTVEPGAPRALLFARAEDAAVLARALEAAGAEIVWSGPDAETAQAEQGRRRPEVLLLDPDLDFQAAVALARSAEGAAAVFLEPRDPIVRDVLVDLRPAGFLSRDASPARASAVLAGARRVPAPDPEPRTRRPPPWILEGAAILFAAVAVALAYQLPGGFENLAASSRPALAAVAALGGLALAALVRAGRPLTAVVQAMVVVVLAILPTHG